MIEEDQEIVTTILNTATSTFHQSSKIEDMPFTAPTDIISFLSRPLQQSTYTQAFLSSGAIQDINLRPYFTSPTIAKKLAGYYHLRGDIKLRITLTAPPYTYGAICIAYAYQHPLGIADPVVAISSYNHIIMDTSLSQSIDFTIPFNDAKNYWTLPNLSDVTTYNIFPKLLMCRLTPITNALTGNAAEYKLTLYQWLDNIQLSTPIKGQFSPESSKSEKAQAKKGPVSTVATAFSEGLSAISNVPLIGNYAKTGSVLAKGLSGLASAFGFSRPYDPDYHTTVGYTPAAISQGNDQFRRLALDPNTQTDLNCFNDINGDSLALANTICREGIIASGIINTDVISVPVSPCYYGGIASTAGAVDYRTNMCPLSYFAATHRYWTGNLIYTLRIHASRYHRGRIRVYWNPNLQLSTYDDATATSLKTQNMLFEIDGSTTVEIDIGWANEKPYLPIRFYSPVTALSVTDSMNVNGYLSIVAVDSIVAPDVTADVYFTLSVRAGESFDLMEPTDTFINYFHQVQKPTTPTFVTKNPNGPTSYVTYAPFDITTQPRLMEPNPEFQLESDKEIRSDVGVKNVIKYSFNKHIHQPQQQYHGERLTSFRSLLKRRVMGANLHDITLPDDVPNIRQASFIPAFPLANDSVSNNILPVLQTPLSYMSKAFRGWHGAMRVNLHPIRHMRSQQDVDDAVEDVFYVFRGVNYPLSNTYTDVTGVQTYLQFQQWKQWYGMNSDSVECFKESVGQEIAVEIPWHLNYNYISTYEQRPLTTPVEGVYVISTKHVAWQISYGIGEDFNFSQYIGIPTVYMYADTSAI